MDKQSWVPVLERAAEDINLSLALRQACRNAVEEVKEIRKGLADLKVQATELWHEADKCRGRLE